MKIVNKKPEDLLAYENNARTHSDYQIAQLKASMTKFGFTNPCLINSDDGVIAGHGRIMAAMSLGLSRIPCVVIEGLTKDEERALVIADNQLALNADWDLDILRREIDELLEAEFDVGVLGFDNKEFNKIMNDLGSESGEVPEIIFSEEIGEEHNYIVLYFGNEMDWLAAQTHFDLKSVHSKRANGKPWSKGVGRVVDGAKYIEGMSDE